MKSRLLSTIWLSLLLLFSQQIAFAGTLKQACNSVADSHQYAFEDDSSSDDAGRQLFLDDLTGLPTSFTLPVIAGYVEVPVETGIIRLSPVVLSYYSSRAPPLL